MKKFSPKRLKEFAPWNVEFLSKSPIFSSLKVPADIIEKEHWPTYETMTRVARDLGLKNTAGLDVSFVVQPPKRRRKSTVTKTTPGYEERIFLSGEIQARFGHWHDFFNMVVWYNYPESKARLNALHFRQKARIDEEALFAWSKGRRTLAQDALSLFDEGGILLLCSENKEIEVKQRLNELGLLGVKSCESFVDIGPVDFRVFGHAIFEGALNRNLVGLENVNGLALVVPLPEKVMNIIAGEEQQNHAGESAMSAAIGHHVDEALKRVLEKSGTLVTPSDYKTISLAAVTRESR